MVTAAFVNMEKPPDDDVCPVCFGEFALPCRADCGHWFCGSCILQVWNFSSPFQACKCPMCCSYIKTLNPQASLLLPQHEEEARKVLKSIESYNRLFVGGAWGFLLKLYDVPIYLRRMFQEMTDPNQVERHVESWRLLAIFETVVHILSKAYSLDDALSHTTYANFYVLKASRTCNDASDAAKIAYISGDKAPFCFVLGSSYMISPFKFIAGDVNVMTFCNSAALAAVIVIKVSGVLKRRRSAERVRRLAAAEAPTGA